MPGVDLDLPMDAEIEWPRAEQSNSSCVVDRKAVIKLFRRVTPGIHPEVEMGRVLTQRGFTGIPPLLGEVTRRDSEAAIAAVGIVQGFITNQGDGSGWTKEMLMRIVDEQSVAPRDRNPFGSYEAFARVLGRRTGEMHTVLAQPTDNPDFAPEAATEKTVQLWLKQAQWQLETAFLALENYTGNARTSLHRLNEQRDDILRALQGLLLPNRGAACTRIHGDFHLGQVLVAGSDVIIIDFEGEPLKPLSERRAKLSPMRDVAGMIRSFDYAAGVVEREGQLSAAGRGHVRAHSLLDQFRYAAEAAFLAGYEDGRGKPLSRKERHLIRAFAIEKAAYEIVYEAANRPDWIDIPLRGLAALLQGEGVEPELADAE
jgi:maltose alpha-D-glucosyltransferase/alpha-amylase